MSRSKTNTKTSRSTDANVDYASMKVAELKALCKKRDVSTVGTKAAIVARLEEHDSEKTSKKSSRKTVQSKKGKVTPKEVSDDEVSEEVPQKNPQKKKTVKKQVKKVETDDESDDVESEEVSAKKTKAKPTKKMTKKVETDVESDEESEEVPVKKTTKKTTKHVKKVETDVDSDVESEEPEIVKKPTKKNVKKVASSEDESEEVPVKKTTKTVKKVVESEYDSEEKVPTKKVTKKKVEPESEPEDESEQENESGDESEPEESESEEKSEKRPVKKTAKKAKESDDEEDVPEPEVKKVRSNKKKVETVPEDEKDSNEQVEDPNLVLDETATYTIRDEVLLNTLKKVFVGGDQTVIEVFSAMRDEFRRLINEADTEDEKPEEFLVVFDETHNAYVKDGYVWDKSSKSVVGKIVEDKIVVLDDKDTQKLEGQKIRSCKITEDELSNVLANEGADDGDAVTLVEKELAEITNIVDEATEEMFSKILKAQTYCKNGDLVAISKKSGVDEDVCKDVLTRIKYYSDKYPKAMAHKVVRKVKAL
jgi:hypothetical protein